MTDEQRTGMSSKHFSICAHIRFAVSHRKDRSMPLALVEQSCTPCRGGMPPLTQEEVEGYCVQAPDWELLDTAKRIEQTYRFLNFREAFPFVERAAALAETEEHISRLRSAGGIRHDLDALQEDQWTALERLHHGGKARSDRGRARKSAGLNRASAIDEQGQGCAGAYRRGEKLAKLAIGVTQYALDAPANSPGAPSLTEGGAHCPHTSCSLTGRTRAPRK